jgi:hypothetical protein
MKIGYRLLAFAFMIVPVSAAEYDNYFEKPVSIKRFKQSAEGMVVEGYDVKDKADRYTIACRVKNGEPGISRWSDGFNEYIHKRPRDILSNERGSTFTSLQWASLCILMK